MVFAVFCEASVYVQFRMSIQAQVDRTQPHNLHLANSRNMHACVRPLPQCAAFLSNKAFSAYSIGLACTCSRACHFSNRTKPIRFVLMFRMLDLRYLPVVPARCPMAFSQHEEWINN